MSEKGFVRETIEAQHQLTGTVPPSISYHCPGHVACECGWVSLACDQALGRREHQKHQDERVQRFAGHSLDEPLKYCPVGSCDNPPDHEGKHRCRCGVLVHEPSPGCQWHQYPPKPMTTSLLKAYLEYAAEGRPIEDTPVLIKGQPIVQARIIDGHVALMTFEDMLTDI